MAGSELIERRTLVGEGFVLLRDDAQVAVAFACINGGWSVRIAGAQFEMPTGQRLLSGRRRRYSEMTYVASEEEARTLAVRKLKRQRRTRTLDAIYRTGCREE